MPWLPAGWKAERDGSIEPQCMGRRGCEFVSPRLRGFAGLDEVCRAAEAISARGGRVNHTCGVHVTVEFAGDASTLARLITLVANHETGIYASTGTHRREGGRYSKAIKVYGDREAAKSRCQSDRYHVLNLTHLARGNDRIEFRAFAGTLNVHKLAGHLMNCLGLIELATAKTRCSAWTYAKKKTGSLSCWDRPDGITELNRGLFHAPENRSPSVRKISTTSLNYVRDHLDYRCANNHSGPDHPTVPWKAEDPQQAVYDDLCAM